MLTGGAPGGGPGGGPGGTTPWGRVGGGPGGGPGGINPGGRGLRMNKSTVLLKSKLPIMSRFWYNENCVVHYDSCCGLRELHSTKKKSVKQQFLG